MMASSCHDIAVELILASRDLRTVSEKTRSAKDTLPVKKFDRMDRLSLI